MMQTVALFLLSAAWVLLTGVDGQHFSDTITNIITVNYGEDAVFNCSSASSLPSKQVAQFTLQKRSFTRDNTFGKTTAIGASSNRFGKQINDPYNGRIDWSAFPSVSTPEITIHNITWSDQALYICTFNIFPTGSESQTTFLNVQGISNITTDVKQTQAQPGELVVVCSATGRPPPVIHWHAGHPNVNLSRETISVWTEENDDHTFTVSSNLTLAAGLLPAPTNFVYCQVDCGASSTRRERISLPLLSAKLEKENGSYGAGSIGLLVVVIIAVLILAIIIKKLRNRSDDV